VAARGGGGGAGVTPAAVAAVARPPVVSLEQAVAPRPRSKAQQAGTALDESLHSSSGLSHRQAVQQALAESPRWRDSPKIVRAGARARLPFGRRVRNRTESKRSGLSVRDVKLVCGSLTLPPRPHGSTPAELAGKKPGRRVQSPRGLLIEATHRARPAISGFAASVGSRAFSSPRRRRSPAAADPRLRVRDRINFQIAGRVRSNRSGSTSIVSP